MYKPESFSFPFEIFKDYDIKDASKHTGLKKDTLISKKILSHNNFTIILKGIIVLYWKDDNNNTTIIDFKTTGQVLRPGIGISEERIGVIYAKAHTDVDLISIDAKFICSCALENNAISDFYYRGLSNDLNSTYIQLKLLKEADLEKRYEIFLEKYKSIYNDISDRMIASYLGVHYTTLARLKAKIAFT